MTDSIILTQDLRDGTSYKAVFSPSQGMNLMSFSRGKIEVIDQETKAPFLERFGGLGPLIGPHFHRRNPSVLPKIANESLFPHIARCKAKGILDPFSHGVARYCPWKVSTITEKMLHAEISGKDLWNGVPLSALEGQNFWMKMDISLDERGLSLILMIVSDTDSLVGIHYYYRLPGGKGVVRSRVKNQCITAGELVDIPPEWGFTGLDLNLKLESAIDSTFFPAPNPLHSEIWLETEEFRLKTSYHSICEENSWQLFHPKNASFVCIEPVSARDPRHPNLSVSSISIRLEIDPPIG